MGSKPEDALAYQLKLSKIKFIQEVQFVPGRKFRADFFIEPNILIEVQGGLHLAWSGGHSSKKGILRDMEKSNLAVLHGFRMLAFDPGAVYSGSALAFIQSVLWGNK